MNKLIKPIITILIGLNLVSCDPYISFVEPVYVGAFNNNSDQEIMLIFKKFTFHAGDYFLILDTMMIAPQSKYLVIDVDHGLYFPLFEAEEEESDFIERAISNYYNRYTPSIDETPLYKLYVQDQLIKQWGLPTGSFGDSINSPFNYDSWEASEYDEVIKTDAFEEIYGELIFTITNEDLE